MKALIINVAANSAMPQIGGPGPVFDDRTFRYKPIPEDDASRGPTYRSLGLIDYVPNPDMTAHYDPEFGGPTYGDYLGKKPNLRKVGAGDLLLFLASLDHVRTGARGFYFIGWILVAAVLSEDDAREDARCKRNAHILRRDDHGFSVFLGKEGQLLPRAVPITRALAANAFLPDGKTWTMRNPRTGRVFQDNERINHLTRFPRLVCDERKVAILRRQLVRHGEASFNFL